MPLSDNGKEVLQDSYMEFVGNLEGLLDELDKLTTAEEGDDFDIMDQILDLIRDSVDEFDDDISELYETEWTDDEEIDDDIEFEDELI